MRVGSASSTLGDGVETVPFWGAGSDVVGSGAGVGMEIDCVKTFVSMIETKHIRIKEIHVLLRCLCSKFILSFKGFNDGFELELVIH